jgi:sphingolipid 4-desaturase/C4-monooxygenase
MTTAAIERHQPPVRPGFHRDRTKAILQDHPQIRDLIGRNPWTFLIIVGLVAMQLSIATLMNDQPCWLIAPIAILFGVFPSLQLYFLMHESGHNLIFRSRSLNILSGIIANTINGFPYSVTYQFYHSRHHSYLGDRATDPDMAQEWESRIVGTSPFRKLAWLVLNPFFLAIRSLRVSSTTVPLGWVFVNAAVVVGFDAAVIIEIGWRAFFYLGLSSYFAMGLPLGAFWIPEHFSVDCSQETYGYYGVLNLIFINRGYHNEHHDFPSVPWSRLPRVRAIAPEWYDSLEANHSYRAALSRFVFDRRLTLLSHVKHA